jgi:cellulose synthase/poly-beta-1,6-N-acetylglucosamine synthase-like glycosyltransferase
MFMKVALGVASETIISDYKGGMEISFIIDFLLLLAAVFYLLVHCGMIAGIKRLDDSKSKEHPFLSIIVSARNEEKNISQLLQCLTRQTYTPCEIIIINDRSTDSTARLISDFQKKYSGITCINITSLQNDMPAKKNALRAGIESSKGEIICFTDADCFPPPHWAEELVRCFRADVGLVAGYSPYQIPLDTISAAGFFHSIFFDFIAYEEFRAAIWSAGSIGWNTGWLCTGRNLAYRRRVYDEVHGFDKIKMSISGDDDLFLQLVRRQTDWKIRYVYSTESFVPTVPPADFWSFVEQRKRHFSAAKFFTLPMMLFFFFYHASNLLLLISPLLYFMNSISLSLMITIVCLKLLADSVLFKCSSRIFGADNFHRSFILMEVLYIAYNSLVGPLGFFRKFAWKQN